MEGEYITKEYAEEPGWHTVGKGKQANVESGVPGNKDQGKRLLSEVLARNKCTKGQKVRQVILASKMPNLPKEDYKIIMRPRGGFKVTNYGLDRLGCCVRNAAGIPRGESEGDIVCVNYKQNILVVSTPSDDRAAKYRHITSLKIGNQEFDTSAYEAAPENTSKGIIRGISLEESPKDIWENLVRPQNPGVLMAKRMGNTTNVIILFDGHYVPNYVKYGCVLAKCVLYRKRIDMCYQCGRLGHRADVCPNPNDKVCRGCGSENPPQDHECEAKCKLCGKNHPTADRKCEARYKLPYLVKKRRWERARREEEEAEAARSLHNAKETKGTYQNSQGPYGGKQSEYNKRDKSQDTRGRDRSGSFPRLNRREEGRSTSRNRSHSDKEEAHSSNGPGGPLQVSWANAVSGARAGAEAASQSKIRELEKELAQIRQMMVQYNQSNAALKEENRKLKEENNRIRKGMAENREVTQVVAEEREIDMEEDVATPAKRKATEDTVGNSEKKTKPVSALPERQEEVEQRIEAKIEEMGARIMQQIQQQLNSIVTRIADIETRIAAWGPQSSGGGPIKTTGKPYIKPPVLTEGAGKL